MCVAEAFSMAAFAAYTTLLPLFQKAWGLSNTEAGLIGGIAFAGYSPAVTSGTAAGVLSAATLAALINLCGPLMSVTGTNSRCASGASRSFSFS